MVFWDGRKGEKKIDRPIGFRNFKLDMIREHAAQGGFPANPVNKITSIIDPVTAE